MGDGSLSQDEIDALLQGADDMLSPSGPAPAAPERGRGGAAQSGEQKTLRDAIAAAVRAVAPSLGGYLGGRTFSISNPVVEVKPQNAIRSEFPGRYVQVAMDYNGALNGRNLVLFNYADAGSISSLMMGDESGAAPTELSEAHQSTIQEFTNLFLSSMATQFGSRIGGGISASPAILSMVGNANDLQIPSGANLYKVTYDFSIQGVISSKFYQIMDSMLATGITAGGNAPVAQQMGQPQQYFQQQSNVGISPVKFPPLDEGIPAGVGGNIGLLLDVPMTLTVELGRTTQLVQDILGLGEGSIIELDKLAGEPVDLLVNGKLIAKGEVVVIDENFGVRVTDIVSPADRLSGIQ